VSRVHVLRARHGLHHILVHAEWFCAASEMVVIISLIVIMLNSRAQTQRLHSTIDVLLLSITLMLLVKSLVRGTHSSSNGLQMIAQG